VVPVVDQEVPEEELALHPVALHLEVPQRDQEVIDGSFLHRSH